MTGHGSQLARKQDDAIHALLTQRNIEEAARAIEVSPKTLLRWMKVPEFDKAYREAKRASFGQAVARLHQASSAAVTTLLKVLVGPNTPAAARVRAAEAVLDRAMKGIEIEDIEARVAALERSVQDNRG